MYSLTPWASLKAMWSLHCVSYKWAEPNFSCHDAQGGYQGIVYGELLLTLAAQYTILKNIHPGHRNWIGILGVICVLFGTIFSSLVEIVKGYRK